MLETSANNKRIAKNTLLLYIRQLVTMCITLYTSRVILNELGVDDYGIYNVVGGFVGMFAVFTSALAVAVSRFITFELGTGNIESLKKVFSTSCFIMMVLTVFIVLLALTGGYWFLNNEMVIPDNRIQAANIVFGICVFNFSLGLLALPFNSALIAHEKMSVYAYISILDAITKLLVALSIAFSPIDKLIFYSILLAIGSCISQTLYIVYGIRNFIECRSGIIPDWSKLREMFGFAGWNVIGGLAAILRDQGGNVVLNMFFGPAVNAARGIANQVCFAVNTFVTSFQMAINPPITKAYASNDIEYFSYLIFQGSRMSYFIVLLFIIPIVFNTDAILLLWLGQVPDHTTLFIQIIFIYILSEAIANPMVTACAATGKMKLFQLTTAPITLLNLPLSYLLLRIGLFPEVVVIIMSVISVVNVFVKAMILRKLTGFSVRWFLVHVCLKVSIVTIVSLIIPFALCRMLPSGFIYTLISCVSSVICTMVSVYVFGFNTSERAMINKFIISKIRK